MAAPNLSVIVTHEQVRAQLGVNVSDVANDTIDATGAYDELYLDYYGWFPKFMDLMNDSSTDPDIVAQQIAVRMYGKYFVCLTVLLTGRLSFFQKIADGENDDRRFDIDFDALQEDFNDQMAKFKGSVLGITTAYTPEVVSAKTYAVFGTSSPSVDIAAK